MFRFHKLQHGVRAIGFLFVGKVDTRYELSKQSPCKDGDCEVWRRRMPAGGVDRCRFSNGEMEGALRIRSAACELVTVPHLD